MYANLSPHEQIDIRLRALESLLAVVISRTLPREAPAHLDDAIDAIFQAVREKATGDPKVIQKNFDTITERIHAILKMAASATTAFENAKGRGKD